MPAVLYTAKTNLRGSIEHVAETEGGEVLDVTRLHGLAEVGPGEYVAVIAGEAMTDETYPGVMDRIMRTIPSDDYWITGLDTDWEIDGDVSWFWISTDAE